MTTDLIPEATAQEVAFLLSPEPPPPRRDEALDVAGAVEAALHDMVHRTDLPPEIRDELWLIHRPLLLLKIRSQSRERKRRFDVIGVRSGRGGV
jgi:hypothetical protein